MVLVIKEVHQSQVFNSLQCGDIEYLTLLNLLNVQE